MLGANKKNMHYQHRGLLNQPHSLLRQSQTCKNMIFQHTHEEEEQSIN